MITYSQIQAIHEAMRECEANGLATYNDRDGYECTTFEALEVKECFAKIRAALAGETPTVSDAIAEREAKLSSVLSVVSEMEAERDEYERVSDPCGAELGYFVAKIRDALSADPFERATPGVSLYEAGREAFSDAGFVPPLLGNSGGINMTIPESTIDMGPGPIVEIECSRMAWPADVAPPLAERSEEDSKITWQG
jgi:hypothetical protein